MQLLSFLFQLEIFLSKKNFSIFYSIIPLGTGHALMGTERSTETPQKIKRDEYTFLSPSHEPSLSRKALSSSPPTSSFIPCAPSGDSPPNQWVNSDPSDTKTTTTSHHSGQLRQSPHESTTITIRTGPPQQPPPPPAQSSPDMQTDSEKPPPSSEVVVEDKEHKEHKEQPGKKVQPTERNNRQKSIFTELTNMVESVFNDLGISDDKGDWNYSSFCF